jgi:hypothetical protein
LQRQLCDGKILHIHIKTVCDISPYFKALFTDRLQGHEPEINAMNLDIPGHILDLILDAYTGHCNWIAPSCLSYKHFHGPNRKHCFQQFLFRYGRLPSVSPDTVDVFYWPLPSNRCFFSRLLHSNSITSAMDRIKFASERISAYNIGVNAEIGFALWNFTF